MSEEKLLTNEEFHEFERKSMENEYCLTSSEK